jgi:predicted enzyme related to lactoylglutathione lyase
MTDPFTVLRAPVTPADPDPVFAARLRARLARALDLPEGVTVTGIFAIPESDQAAPPAERGMPPAQQGAAIPYLAVRGARAALDWYAQVLGGRLRGEPIIMPDGRVGHAELELATGMIYLADEHPEIGHRAPEPGGVPVSLVLTVADVDQVVQAAVGAGASLDREPYQAHGYRNATVTDPFGHRWMLQAPAAAPPAAAGHGQRRPRQGDIGYASLWVPDVARAAAFYGPVLGVEYQPAHGGRGWQAAGVIPSQGFWGGAGQPALFCSYVVDDAAAAVARVRAAGGQASEPVPRPYGPTADCTDIDGTRFAVFQPRVGPAGAQPAGAGYDPAATGPEPAAAGSEPGPGGRDGDLIYVTLEVPDAARTLAFYRAVLGWQARPGRSPGGWQVEGITPMIGVSDGHERAAAVPVWRVADVAAAVARARATGGTATEPHQEPYGLIAECRDDQGARFSVCEFPR